MPIEVVPLPPRRGPGKPPKKRGPGRPPKKRPEEMPDYCPEFLDKKLFVDTNVTKNERRTELVYHFQHIDTFHTRDPIRSIGADVITLPKKAIQKPESDVFLELRSINSDHQFVLSVSSDSEAGSLIEYIKGEIPKCKTVQLFHNEKGGNPIRPNDLVLALKRENLPLYFEHK